MESRPSTLLTTSLEIIDEYEDFRDFAPPAVPVRITSGLGEIAFDQTATRNVAIAARRLGKGPILSVMGNSRLPFCGVPVV